MKNLLIVRFQTRNLLSFSLQKKTQFPKRSSFATRLRHVGRWRTQHVDRKGTRVLPFHSAVSQKSRLASIKDFSNGHSDDVSLFLVCTDRASRGIEFPGVDHVILFDYPRDPCEYVRHVGRTARGACGKGKAFVFAVGTPVMLARKVMDRNRKGHPLHDVPNAYEFIG